MTDDIVARLRSWWADHGDGGGTTRAEEQTEDLCNAAAAEIERLRLEAASWRGIAEGKDIVIRRLEADIAALSARGPVGPQTGALGQEGD